MTYSKYNETFYTTKLCSKVEKVEICSKVERLFVLLLGQSSALIL